MKDHESVIVNQLEEKGRKLREENSLLQDEAFRQAPVLDKIHAYLTMLAIVVIVFSPVYLIVSLIRIYVLK